MEVPPKAGLAAPKGALIGANSAMSLVRGAQLGPYEVRSLLGKGGMGEVYCAHDARLGRDVAIKVLLQYATFLRALVDATDALPSVVYVAGVVKMVTRQEGRALAHIGWLERNASAAGAPQAQPGA